MKLVRTGSRESLALNVGPHLSHGYEKEKHSTQTGSLGLEGKAREVKQWAIPGIAVEYVQAPSQGRPGLDASV